MHSTLDADKHIRRRQITVIRRSAAAAACTMSMASFKPRLDDDAIGVLIDDVLQQCGRRTAAQRHDATEQPWRATRNER